MNLVRLIAAVVFAFSAVSTAYCATESTVSPEETVRAFYRWFIEHNNDQTYPLREPDIYRYVAKETVYLLNDDYRRGYLPGDVDYFLKVQDFYEKDWLAHIDMHPTVMMHDAAVVPLTFGSTEKVDVLVFLKKRDGRWKIVKVDDTRDYR